MAGMDDELDSLEQKFKDLVINEKTFKWVSISQFFLSQA
jgi:hypothetical protein